MKADVKRMRWRRCHGKKPKPKLQQQIADEDFILQHEIKNKLINQLKHLYLGVFAAFL
jgi:hypothetical protein